MNLRHLVVAVMFALLGCTPPFFDLANQGPPPPGSQGQGGFGGSTGAGACGGTEHPPLQNGPVTAPAKAPPAISGGTMAVLGDGTVVAADPDRDQLHVFSAANGLTHVSLPEGSEPGRVAEGPAGQVFVALRALGQVAIVDLTTGAVTLEQACASPRGLVYQPKRGALWVACATGELARIDFAAGKRVVHSSHPVDDLRDLMLVNGDLWATTFRDANLWAIDTLTMTAVPLAGPQPFENGVTMQPQVAWRAVAANGVVTVVHQAEQVEAVATPGACTSSYGAPPNAGPTSAPPTIVSMVTTVSGTGYSSVVIPGVLPVDVAVSADGSRFAVASAGTNEVEMMFDQRVTPVALPGQPISVGFLPNGELWVYLRQPASFAVIDQYGELVRTLATSEVQAVSTGHDLFHVATSNAIACASCHPEAGDDGHVWALPEGTFKTPSLRGTISGTEPFHWRGEELEMGLLMNDIFVSRMNGAPQSTERTQALLDWLDRQPARAAPTDLDPGAVARGETTFNAAGCAACHAGTAGTNNASVDVGTGGVFQVPRLRELAYRAPFMHDGRAAKLEDRFGEAGGTAHGDTSALSPGQLADLVAYLKSR